MASSKKNNVNSDSLSGKRKEKKTPQKAISSKRAIFHADTNQTHFLIKAGKLVSEQAIREANALGLEIMYIEDGILYREKDGKRKVVSNIEKTKSSTKYKLFKKGVTLYVKK
jgi:hypothetical protein